MFLIFIYYIVNASFPLGVTREGEIFFMIFASMELFVEVIVMAILLVAAIRVLWKAREDSKHCLCGLHRSQNSILVEAVCKIAEYDPPKNKLEAYDFYSFAHTVAKKAVEDYNELYVDSAEKMR